MKFQEHYPIMQRLDVEVFVQFILDVPLFVPDVKSLGRKSGRIYIYICCIGVRPEGV